MVPTSRLISSCRQLLRRNGLPLTKVGEAARRFHVVSVPPENKIPRSEMNAMGVVLVVSIWFIPAWILYHIPIYQGEDRTQYTGK